jgi:hypothetical protein
MATATVQCSRQLMAPKMRNWGIAGENATARAHCSRPVMTPARKCHIRDAGVGCQIICSQGKVSLVLHPTSDYVHLLRPRRLAQARNDIGWELLEDSHVQVSDYSLPNGFLAVLFACFVEGFAPEGVLVCRHATSATRLALSDYFGFLPAGWFKLFLMNIFPVHVYEGPVRASGLVGVFQHAQTLDRQKSVYH